MRSFTMSTTQRNQVTIPGEVRHHLGIESRDKVSFTIEDNGAVRLRKAPFTLETVYGSVKALEDHGDLEDIIRMAKEEKASDLAQYPFLDFADALGVAHMEARGIAEILSYDMDFDRLPGVARVEP